MVRNAARIISLTVFKLRDPKINELMEDMPFCSYFCNLACLFRDKILEIDSSYCGTANKNYELLFNSFEDF